MEPVCFYRGSYSYFRRSYYKTYASPSKLVRCLGVVTLFSIMVPASIGYVVSRGPLHGATAGAIPIVGDTIDSYLALGRLDNATLNRFSSLHYLLPFIIVGASILHPAASRYGSNNPLV